MQSSIQHIYDYIGNDLAQVDQTIKSCVANREKYIQILSEHLISAGGKRLRPVFALLSAKLFNYGGSNHIKIAAAVECIHSATLLHDDVVDESELRRGKLTAHQKWGNKCSILVGDFLFSQAFGLMVSTNSLAVLDVLSSASAIIAEGEVMQLSFSSNLELSKQQYIDIVKAKTAELFAAACKAGAIIANQSQETCELMYEFGLNVGVAFQIIDDLLDYTASVDDLGKNIGDDFHEGKVTLPVLITYQLAGDEEKTQLVGIFANVDKAETEFALLKDMMHKYQAFAISTDLASEFITKSTKYLERFPSHPVKNMFSEILEFQLKRLS